MLAVGDAPDTAQVWAAGRGAGNRSSVERICLADERSTASRSPETSVSDAPAAPEQRTAATTGARQGAPEAPPAEVNRWAAPLGGAAVAVEAVDKARNAGLYQVTKTYGAVVADFDNDRSPDIFLGRHADEPRLLMNSGNGHFEETNRGAFGADDRHECAAADVNRDRRLDLFCAFGANHGTGFKLNRLYVQQPNQTFVEQTAAYGLLEPFARARNAVFLDANGDAHPDLFTMNESDRGDGLPSHNRLFVNRGGNDGFRDAPEYGLEREGEGGHATLGDIDGDGRQDLLVAEEPHRDDELSELLVYRHEEGQGFTEVAAEVGLGQRVVDAILADVNGDRRPDVVALTPDSLEVYLNADGRFSRAFSTAVAGGFWLAAGDVNGDQRPDLYVMRGRSGDADNAPDAVYLNDGTGERFDPIPSIPSTNQGVAESVWPIDYDGNGLTDFLVLNGLHADDPGPVQLIAFFPVGPDRSTAAAATAPNGDR